MRVSREGCKGRCAREGVQKRAGGGRTVRTNLYG